MMPRISPTMRRRCHLPVLGLLVVFVGLTACQDETPLIKAIRSKSAEQLKAILVQASVEHPADADAETLRGLLFEHAQKEIPGGQVKPWPGPADPSAKPAPVEPERKAKMPAGMADMFFKKLDVNQDGVLSREEMQGMIDEVNAAATAKGLPTHDLFSSLDANGDGTVDKGEAATFFETVAPSILGGGGAKQQVPPRRGAPTQEAEEAGLADMSSLLFKSLDKDKDNRLGKAEMEKLIGAANAAAKARGDPEDDFFASMDVDSDGSIDRKEADAFFEAMAKSGVLGDMGGGAVKKDEL